MAEITNNSEHGIVYSISRSTVVAEKMFGATMSEIVHVGRNKLVGEIVRLEDDRATIQVFDDIVGISIGEPVVRTFKPLSVELGPGIMGNFFDGLQRPLQIVEAETGGYTIPKGFSIPALSRTKKWSFEPLLKIGDHITGGDIYGKVSETPKFVHKIMLPPGEMGRITFIASPNEYTIEDIVLEIEFDSKIKRFTMVQTWPVRVPRPYSDKFISNQPMLFGQRALESLFPLARGGTCAITGYYGCGKSNIIWSLFRDSESDCVVYVNSGERVNDVSDIIMSFPEVTERRKLGEEWGKNRMPIIHRSVLVVNTVSMPVAAREAAALMGVTIAEYIRDMGYDVSLVNDSLTRWAEALKETSLALTQVSNGYSPAIMDRIIKFYSRAGCVDCVGNPSRQGSVTIVASISPDYILESVKDHVQTYWGLDIALARRKHWPSVSWTESFSKYQSDLIRFYHKEIHPDFESVQDQIKQILRRSDELTESVQVLVNVELPEIDQLTLAVAKIIKDDFLQQNGFSIYDTYCPLYKSFYMMRNIAAFYRLAERAIRSEHLNNIKDLYNVNSTKEVLYRLTCMKFEDPSSITKETIIAKLDALLNDIEQMFLDLEDKYYER